MGTLTCVRHGQASFGAANYDQLSALGEDQARRLGLYFAQQGLRFDALWLGTLARHRQTADALLQGMNFERNSTDAQVFIDFVAIKSGISETTDAALNEYDSEALIAAALMAAPPAEPLPSPHTPEGYKAHFRLLRQALKAWIDGSLTPADMPSFAEFRAGLARVAQTIAEQPDAQVLLVSSGGPLSTLMMHVLQAHPLCMIDLNFQMKNTAITRFHLSKGKLHLSGFNALPHLDAPELRHMQTST